MPLAHSQSAECPACITHACTVDYCVFVLMDSEKNRDSFEAGDGDGKLFNDDSIHLACDGDIKGRTL